MITLNGPRSVSPQDVATGNAFIMGRINSYISGVQERKIDPDLHAASPTTPIVVLTKICTISINNKLYSFEIDIDNNGNVIRCCLMERLPQKEVCFKLENGSLPYTLGPVNRVGSIQYGTLSAMPLRWCWYEGTDVSGLHRVKRIQWDPDLVEPEFTLYTGILVGLNEFDILSSQ